MISHLSDTLKLLATSFAFKLKSITCENNKFFPYYTIFLLQNPLPTFCIGARLRCIVFPFYHGRAFMVFVLRIYLKFCRTKSKGIICMIKIAQ